MVSGVEDPKITIGGIASKKRTELEFSQVSPRLFELVHQNVPELISDSLI